jgi:hypothetical protein
MNVRYHQHYVCKWRIVDRAIRIAVGILAVFGLLFSVPGFDYQPWGLIVGIVSLITAVVLNIVPVGDWEKLHGELFRLWADLRKQAAKENHRACDLDDDETKEVTKAMAERLGDLDEDGQVLDSMEPAPSKAFLKECLGDEIESVWGQGIRTYEAAERARSARIPPTVTSPSVAASAAGPE